MSARSFWMILMTQTVEQLAKSGTRLMSSRLLATLSRSLSDSGRSDATSGAYRERKLYE